MLFMARPARGCPSDHGGYADYADYAKYAEFGIFAIYLLSMLNKLTGLTMLSVWPGETWLKITIPQLVSLGQPMLVMARPARGWPFLVY